MGEEHISRSLSLKISDSGVAICMAILLDFIHCLFASYLKLCFRSWFYLLLHMASGRTNLLSLLGSIEDLVSVLD